jgi:hypothetical protein
LTDAKMTAPPATAMHCRCMLLSWVATKKWSSFLSPAATQRGAQSACVHYCRVSTPMQAALKVATGQSEMIHINQRAAATTSKPPHLAAPADTRPRSSCRRHAHTCAAGSASAVDGRLSSGRLGEWGVGCSFSFWYKS